MDINDLIKLLLQKQSDTYNTTKQATMEAADRFKMSDPEVQGPRLPDYTDADRAVAEQTAALAPIGALKPLGTKLQAIKNVADSTYNMAEMGTLGMDSVRRTTNALARETDFAQRTADQIKAARLAALRNKLK